MAWCYLWLAAFLEILWALALKQAVSGRPWMWALFLVGANASMILLGLAARSLPLGLAYALWTGIGAVGVALAAWLWLGQSLNAIQCVCLLLIVIGGAGFKLAS